MHKLCTYVQQNIKHTQYSTVCWFSAVSSPLLFTFLHIFTPVNCCVLWSPSFLPPPWCGRHPFYLLPGVVAILSTSSLVWSPSFLPPPWCGRHPFYLLPGVVAILSTSSLVWLPSFLPPPWCGRHPFYLLPGVVAILSTSSLVTQNMWSRSVTLQTFNTQDYTRFPHLGSWVSSLVRWLLAEVS